MRKAIQRGLLSVALATGSFAAFAGGSNPGLYYGQIPTAAQWNSYFAAKLDYTPGAANSIPYWDGSGSLLNAPISGDCTSAANVFACNASNINGGTQWGVLYQSASGVTASTTAGSAGQVLTSNATSAPTFQDIGNPFAASIHAATNKTTPVGADEVGIWDSVSGLLNKVTFTNLLNYFAPTSGNATQTFSVATATAAAHAIRSDQISTDNTNFPIYTAPATWTPTDASGAGLTFSSVTGYITKIGKLRIARFSLTFPVTADGSNVSIGGLPEAAASHGPNSIQGFFVSTSTITSRGLYGGGGSSSVAIDKNNGAAVAINSDFSGCVLYATLFYEVE